MEKALSYFKNIEIKNDIGDGDLVLYNVETAKTLPNGWAAGELYHQVFLTQFTDRIQCEIYASTTGDQPGMLLAKFDFPND